MKKISYLFFASIICAANANAQRNLGIATSDWSGLNQLYLNPANIADSREKIVIDIFSVNAGVDNNLGTLNTIGSMVDALNNGGSTSDIFKYSNNQTFSLMAPHTEVRGPGIMYSINRRHSVALTTGVRVYNQFNNFDQSLFRTLTDPDYVYSGSGSGDVDLTSQNFNYTVQSWAQVGLSYGVLLIDKKQHKIKAGVTLRYLKGIGYVGMKGRNLDAHYRSGKDSVYVTNSDVEFASNLLSTRSAFTEGFANNNVFNNIFGANGGTGVGGDIGVVYDYMPANHSTHHHKNDSRYKLRVSASVTDIGAINYNKGSNANAKLTGNGYITAKGFDGVNNFDEFRAYAKRQGFTADTNSKATRLTLPTTMILGADYNIVNNFYVNATFIGNLADRNAFGNSYYGQVTVTPRYDRKWYTIAVPLSYGMLAKNFRAGLGLRVSGFYIGSDDMLALVASNQYGINIYAGGYVPLYKHKRGRHYKISEVEEETNEPAAEPDMERRDATDTADNCPDLIELTLAAPHTSATTVITASTMANMPYDKAAILANKNEIADLNRADKKKS